MLQSADRQIVTLLNNAVGHFQPWDNFMEAMVSDYLVPVAGSLMVFGLWFLGPEASRVRNQIAAITATASMGIASLVTLIVNGLYFRERPFVSQDLNLLFYQPTDSSFPSNSAAVAFAIAAAIFSAHHRLGIMMYILAFMWAFARVYSGVHYPSDVIVGAGLGILTTILVRSCIYKLRPLIQRLLSALKALYLA